jgi:hypothetical protein
MIYTAQYVMLLMQANLLRGYRWTRLDMQRLAYAAVLNMDICYWEMAANPAKISAAGEKSTSLQ